MPETTTFGAKAQQPFRILRQTALYSKIIALNLQFYSLAAYEKAVRGIRQIDKSGGIPQTMSRPRPLCWKFE
jgi:hypothetical protein